MEKSFKLTLTDEQKREIADALGVPIDHVGVQVAYTQAFDEDAKGNDAVVAKLSEKADDGKVWVVEQLSMVGQRPDGSGVAMNLGTVAGGLQTLQGRVEGSPGALRTAPAERLAPQGLAPQALKGEKKL